MAGSLRCGKPLQSTAGRAHGESCRGGGLRHRGHKTNRDAADVATHDQCATLGSTQPWAQASHGLKPWAQASHGLQPWFPASHGLQIWPPDMASSHGLQPWAAASHGRQTAMGSSQPWPCAPSQPWDPAMGSSQPWGPASRGPQPAVGSSQRWTPTSHGLRPGINSSQPHVGYGQSRAPARQILTRDRRGEFRSLTHHPRRPRSP